MKGWKSVALTINKKGPTRVLEVQKDLVKIHNKSKFCIGDTCITDKHLKLLTDGIKLKIIDGKFKNKYLYNHGDGKRIGPHHRYPGKYKLENA